MLTRDPASPHSNEPQLAAPSSLNRQTTPLLTGHGPPEANTCSTARVSASARGAPSFERGSKSWRSTIGVPMRPTESV